jgi:hypothetical protein
MRCPFVPVTKSTHLKRATGIGAWNFDSNFRVIIGYAVPNIIEIYPLYWADATINSQNTIRRYAYQGAEEIAERQYTTAQPVSYYLVHC